MKLKSEIVEIVVKVRIRYDNDKLLKKAIRMAVEDAKYGLRTSSIGCDGRYDNHSVSAKVMKKEKKEKT